jgi:hypothetical protein
VVIEDASTASSRSSVAFSDGSIEYFSQRESKSARILSRALGLRSLRRRAPRARAFALFARETKVEGGKESGLFEVIQHPGVAAIDPSVPRIWIQMVFELGDPDNARLQARRLGVSAVLAVRRSTRERPGPPGLFPPRRETPSRLEIVADRPTKRISLGANSRLSSHTVPRSLSAM